MSNVIWSDWNPKGQLNHNSTFMQGGILPWNLQLYNTGAATAQVFATGGPDYDCLSYARISVTTGGGTTDVRLAQNTDMFGNPNIKIRGGQRYYFIAFFRCSTADKYVRVNVYNYANSTGYNSDVWNSWVPNEWTLKYFYFDNPMTCRNALFRIYLGSNAGNVDITLCQLQEGYDSASGDQCKAHLEEIIKRLGVVGNQFNVYGKTSWPDLIDGLTVTPGKFFDLSTRQIVEVNEQDVEVPTFQDRKIWKYGLLYLSQTTGVAGITEGVGVQWPQEAEVPPMPMGVDELVPLFRARLVSNQIGLRGPDLQDMRCLFRMGKDTYGDAGVEIFNTGGTFVVPATGPYLVIACGGGGGGGGGSRATGGYGGTGGSGAGLVMGVFQLTQSANITVTLGVGGSGGGVQYTLNQDGYNGSNGGSTTFGSYLTASGGKGGTGGSWTGTTRYGPLGGLFQVNNATYQLVRSQGQQGGDSTSSNGGIGGRAAGNWGLGGSPSGGSGGAYGGGGAGGNNYGTGNGGGGGQGANGRLVVAWWR